ncbi:STAS/SEC14 domain-containing protein [uncultured Microscilla sp.]|uniref:STAS/SEC14 domain-containing protein n=1 Tax=uncultured Microscilla sp. TaxID=432653 RepID=UPI00262E5D62|nr:STAS/SEC14 domain-containing protein [uncultured Microscilla sp.]
MPRIKLSDDDNKYFTSYFDEELNMYELFWSKESEDMEDEEYKVLMETQVKQILDNNYSTEIFLLDNREFLFSMSPDLQEWQANEIFAKMVTKQVKIAVLVSSDFIAQLSIEQAMEEDENAGQTTKYFEEEQEAREWILGL